MASTSSDNNEARCVSSIKKVVFVNDSFVEEDENVVDDDDCVVELVDEVAVDCEVVDCDDDDDDCDTVDVVFVISLCLLGTAVLVFFVVDSSSSSIGYVSTGVGGGVVVLFVEEEESWYSLLSTLKRRWIPKHDTRMPLP